MNLNMATLSNAIDTPIAKHWPVVRLGDVVKQRKECINIEDTRTYKRCRVQLHTQGIVLRDEIEGARIKTKEQQVCHADELLVAEIDAKVGGFGIVPVELEGAIVSSHYFLFTINTSKLEPRFLGYYLKTPFFQDQVNARGSTNYAAIRPHHVFSYTMPLPPLTEQRRITAKIDQLAAKISEAQTLRTSCSHAISLLLDSFFNEILRQAKTARGWRYVSIPEVAEVNPRRPNLGLSPDTLVTFVPMAAIDESTGTIVTPQNRPLSEVIKGYTYFEEGDVLFARITPCMQNGKSAVARNLMNRIGFGTAEFHVIRPKAYIDSDYLHALVRSKSFRRDAESHFKGTAGQQRVPEIFLINRIIPVPPLEEQQRIVVRCF